MSIGKNIKKIRNTKGLSTYDLAEMTDISQPVISKIENGKRSQDVNLIKKIAKALEVPMSLLLKDEESINNISNELCKIVEVQGMPDTTEEEVREAVKDILKQDPSIFFELDDNIRNELIYQDKKSIYDIVPLEAQEELKSFIEYLNYKYNKKKGD